MGHTVCLHVQNDGFTASIIKKVLHYHRQTYSCCLVCKQVCLFVCKISLQFVWLSTCWSERNSVPCCDIWFRKLQIGISYLYQPVKKNCHNKMYVHYINIHKHSTYIKSRKKFGPLDKITSKTLFYTSDSCNSGHSENYENNFRFKFSTERYMYKIF